MNPDESQYEAVSTADLDAANQALADAEKRIRANSHHAATLRRVREVLQDQSTFRDQRVTLALQVMDAGVEVSDDLTVTIDEEDRVELSHMLRGRGGSALKTKLLDALSTLDSNHAAELRRLKS